MEKRNVSRSGTYPGLRPLAIAAALVVAVSGCTTSPTRISPAEARAQAQSDLAILTASQAPVTKPITLADAMARAVKYNRDSRLKVMEAAIAEHQLSVTRFNMLPQLTASAGYHERSDYLAAASVTFKNGEPAALNNPTYSVSEDKQRHTDGLDASWNILDFGLSFVTAREQADRYLIAREQERKVVHNIMQDVRDAYWRAVSADRLMAKIGPLMKKVDLALKQSREVEKKRLEQPLDALTYQRELLDMQRSLQVLERNLTGAKIQLSSLMGLRPGTEFTLADVQTKSLPVPTVAVNLKAMERVALERRPELMASRYQTRISKRELHASLLRMLPGINLFASGQRDSNQFLLNNQWVEYSARVSWNLLNVFKFPAEYRLAKSQEVLARQQRLALSLAVLTQVYLANVRYRQALAEYQTAQEYLDVVQRIAQQVQARNKTRSEGKLPLIREELNLLLAEVRRDVSYARLQNSFGRVFVSMGLDPLPPTIHSESIPALASAISRRIQGWEHGAWEPELRQALPVETRELGNKSGEHSAPKHS